MLCKEILFVYSNNHEQIKAISVTGYGGLEGL
jgi:hypothetical protein